MYFPIFSLKWKNTSGYTPSIELNLFSTSSHHFTNTPVHVYNIQTDAVGNQKEAHKSKKYSSNHTFI